MTAALVEVDGLTKHFTRGGGLFHRGSLVKAVDGVSFAIAEGETFGLVGESGSGKSTTGRCMLRLIEPTSGQVRYRGEDVLAYSSSQMRAARRHLQMIFQDPYSSLNPRMRAREIVEEPLLIHKLGSKAARRARVAELFALVGLDPAHLDRYPHEFSGGQRQRIAIARALLADPAILVLDEATSNLDTESERLIQESLTRLLRGRTTLVIAHRLSTIAGADQIAVVDGGTVVERGRHDELMGKGGRYRRMVELQQQGSSDPWQESK